MGENNVKTYFVYVDNNDKLSKYAIPATSEEDAYDYTMNMGAVEPGGFIAGIKEVDLKVSSDELITAFKAVRFNKYKGDLILRFLIRTGLVEQDTQVEDLLDGEA